MPQEFEVIHSDDPRIYDAANFIDWDALAVLRLLADLEATPPEDWN